MKNWAACLNGDPVAWLLERSNSSVRYLTLINILERKTTDPEARGAKEAIMVWSLIKLGYLKDERVEKGIEWIVKYQRFDDGIDAHLEGWPYDRYEMCWGKHSCHMGVVKAMKALSALPKELRSKNINSTIKRGRDYLLAHHIYRQSHKGKWTLERTFNGRFQVDIEAKGKPSKWITYRALNVLKKYHEIENDAR